MKISSILERIDENQMFVPAFQREYVWKKDDAKELIDSLIKDYPTGTMLLWETNNPPELKGAYKYDTRQGNVRILLDGQQRITTLYMLITGKYPPYYQEHEITHDIRGLYVNVETLELSYFAKTKMENNPRWQNITDIFKKTVNPIDVFKLLEEQNGGEEISRDRQNLIFSNISNIERILDREFPEQTIPAKASIREAIDIFYKVNASGVSLTEAELALAQISGYWAEARDMFKAKLEELNKQGFPLKLDFIVYALLGCLYHMGSDMRKLHSEDNKERVQAAWKILEGKTLDYVFNILRSKAYVDHEKEVSSIYAVVPIIVYCFQKQEKHLSDIEIRKVVKWFYYSQIRRRYISQLPQKLDFDLKIVRDSEQPFDDLLSVISDESRLEILPTEFIGRGVQHPLFAMMRWYFKSKSAVCFTTGVKLHKNMGKKYQLEYDHIFPSAKLSAAGYGQENRHKFALAQEITNRAILTQIANREKSDQPAQDYLSTVKENYPQALSLQLVPEDEDLWKIENFEMFLQKRREMLAEELNQYLEQITETALSEIPISLEDIINNGENEEIEFKSSLRWDCENEVLNKDLESVIAKTIAALSNADGGLLLIGVEDDGKILGLVKDYETLSGDKDKFERHLMGIITNHFGESFAVSKIKISFPIVYGEEICKVEIRPASNLLVFKSKDKNGQAKEAVYSRRGNASVEIPPSELQTFIKERFG